MTSPAVVPTLQADDEIDLRALAHRLFDNWRLIAIITAIAAFIGTAMSLLWPRSFQATALVTVVQPRYSLELEGVRRESAPAPRSYPDLATSDQVLVRVLETNPNGASDVQSDPAGLRDKLHIAVSPDGTLLQLTVEDPGPSTAARLANDWAKAFISVVQEVYGPGSTLLASYDEEVLAAKKTLMDTEQQLADFQTLNQAPVISTTLGSLQNNLSDLLSLRFEMDQLLSDTRDMRLRLEAYDPSTPLSVSDELAVLLLNARATGGTNVRLQFQLSGSVSTSPKLAREAVTQVDELIKSLEGRVADLSQQAKAIEPEILDVQGKLAQVQAQEAQLLRARELAENQYLGLDEKVREVHVAAQEAENTARLASAASVPPRPAGPGNVQLIVGTSAVGLALAVLFVIGNAWWKGAGTSNSTVVSNTSHES